MNNNKATDQLELTAEQTQEILEKYDPEAGYRKYTGIMAWIVSLGLLGFSIFQLYTAIFGVLPAQLQRSIHLAFALGLIFLLFPISKKEKAKAKKKRFLLPWYDAILSILGVLVGLYWLFNYEGLLVRSANLTTLDLIVAGLAILLVLEAARRVVGLPITIVAIIFLLYAYFGPYMPGFLNHPGISFERILSTMYYSTEGILGTPLKVSSTFIFLFLIFGAFLVKTGVGNYFNDFATLIAGRSIGGPAKVAVFSSALQGTISGSSVSNVVTSGSFTIPMMKRLGYSKEFAGAVEAAASTGGQLMPPIMGAAAFLMVEFIGGGISYWDIVKSAAIPAILYFAGIWIVTHLEAKRIGLRGLSKEELPNRKEVLKNIYLLAPIVAIIVLLMTNMTITRAALWAILISIIVGVIHRFREFRFFDIIEALIDGARTALGVAAATASAGIIVGVVTLTGLGLKMANGLVELSGGIAFLTLFFTMIASLILGMGSPTTANYIITSTIAAPAIVALGFPALAAHMFVFYFGIIADITPPVALAAFAASGISGGEPIKTGVNATKLAIAAWIIPYVFVFSPALLLIDSTWYQTLWVIFTAFTGMIAVGAGVVGYWVRKTNWIERILCIIAGILLIIPEGYTDITGLVLFIILLASQYMIKQDRSLSMRS